MATRSLILTSAQAGTGKKLTKTITNVNPNATADVMKTFAQKLSALTTDTYIQTDCIDKHNVDTENVPANTDSNDTRTEVTFSFDVESFLTGLTGESKRTKYTTNSDGELSIAVNGNHGVLVGVFIDNDTGETKIGNMPFGRTKTAGTLTVRITGTETYKPFEQTYDFT